MRDRIPPPARFAPRRVFCAALPGRRGAVTVPGAGQPRGVASKALALRAGLR